MPNAVPLRTLRQSSSSHEARNVVRCGLRNSCSMHRIFKYSRDWMSVRSVERMSRVIFGMAVKVLNNMGVRAFLMVACGALALPMAAQQRGPLPPPPPGTVAPSSARSEEHTSELQSRLHLVCRLLLEKKK